MSNEINRAALNKQLEMLTAKMNNPEKYSWQDITDFRSKELGIEENSTTIRKGAKLLYEYLQNGYELRPIVDQRVKTTILSISDLHYPFQLPISTFADYAGRVDILQLNGDLLDCTNLSKFTKVGRSNQIDEMIGLREYLIQLIEMLRPKKVVANYGNHEDRLTTYVSKAFNGGEMQELFPTTLLSYIFTEGFNHYDKSIGAKIFYEPICNVVDCEIEYNDTWYSVIGDVIFTHPRTFSSVPMRTAEKALYWFRNEGYNFRALIMSHTHRVGTYKIGGNSGNRNASTLILEQGCTCDVSKMHYADGLLVNSQKEGFALVYLDENDHVLNDLTKLVTLN